jgi:TolB-like protein/class 3 adenylate cyclase/Tfp pilus assembly protein PilF
MSTEIKKEIQLEIAHVLFVDIVGYSNLLINEQRRLLEVLNRIVRGTEQFRTAEANSRLITIPTGDGMALVFYNTPEAPVECALEISRAVKEHPELKLRMGAHSGPVSGVIDVTGHANLAGAGLNMAQRIMDCGGAGHILISKHVAEDLDQYAHWRPLLHDLGECEVKHGARVHVVNLYTEELGNPEMPEQFKQAAGAGKAAAISKPIERPISRSWAMIGAVLLMIAAVVTGLVIFLAKRSPSGAITSTATPEKSIAVLPFENFSEDKAFAFFADGVQDEILTDLAKIADLKVISRTSVMQYKGGLTRNLPEIAQALKVAHVLEGSVQRSANRVRVSAQLIDARTDTHVWAEKYDRDLADVFAIQSEIAEKIADQLQAKLSPMEKSAMNERPTSDLVAYDLYLRAKELIYEGRYAAREKENYFKAVQLLDQAVARDPAFLLAYCQLAYAHDLIYFLDFDHAETRLALAETCVRAAVRLQPDAGETNLAQAIHFYWGYRNYDQALEELAKAERGLPNNARIFQFLGLINRRQGRWDEAIRNLERAVDLDPRNADTITDLRDLYSTLRRYGESIAMANRDAALQPRSASQRAVPAWIGVAADANMAPLRATLNTIEAEGPASAAEVADISFQTALRERDPAGAARALANIPSEGYRREADYPVPHTWHEGLLAKLRQDAPAAHAAFMAARAETEKLVRAQPENVKPLSALAFVDAELGDKEKAIREGRTACDMVPVAKDAIDGVLLVNNLARIYSLTGEKDLAIKQLEIVSKIPCGPSYGELRLDPEWDSLRGDPRFEKIVASLAPKPANK